MPEHDGTVRFLSFSQIDSNRNAAHHIPSSLDQLMDLRRPCHSKSFGTTLEANQRPDGTESCLYPHRILPLSVSNCKEANMCLSFVCCPLGENIENMQGCVESAGDGTGRWLHPRLSTLPWRSLDPRLFVWSQKVIAASIPCRCCMPIKIKRFSRKDGCRYCHSIG